VQTHKIRKYKEFSITACHNPPFRVNCRNLSVTPFISIVSPAEVRAVEYEAIKIMNGETKGAANQSFIAELKRLFLKSYIRGRKAGLWKLSVRVPGLKPRFQRACFFQSGTQMRILIILNPLNPELNPICYLVAFLVHHFLHVSRIRVKLLTFRLLMTYIYIYGAPILDVSRSHTTTQHSR